MPVAGRTKKDVLLEFRQSELLTAARTVFARKGFHAATIDEIAHAAGVAKGTVYLYFGSKQEIYFQALRFGIKNLNLELKARAAEPVSCKEKLQNLVAAKIAFFDEHRDFFRIFHFELAESPADMSGLNQFKDLYFEQARLIEKVLRDGIKEGAVRRLNVQKTAFAVSDLTRGIAIQRVLGWSKTRLDEEVDFIFNLLWKGIES